MAVVTFTGSVDTGRRIQAATVPRLKRVTLELAGRAISRAHRASQRLDTGTVWIDTYLRVDPTVPYGGVKQSGYGRNLGAAPLDDFTRTKSVWINLA